MDAEMLLNEIKDLLAQGREDLAKAAIVQYGLTRLEDGKRLAGWKGKSVV